MTYKWPSALWISWFVAAGAIVYIGFQLRRRTYAHRFTTPPMVPNVVVAGPGWRRHVPMAFYLLALLVLVIGLARPQLPTRVPREQATVVMALDSSRSMRGVDVEPNRIRAAKSTARAFVNRLPPRWKVGLVSFSGIALIILTPTTDRIAAVDKISDLELRSGTALGDAITQALPREKPEIATTVVVLTDGNENVGDVDPVDAARLARRLEVKVYTIGLGEPGLGSIGDEAKPANFDVLRRIARITDGRFFLARDRAALEDAYRKLETSVVYVRAPREVTAAFAGGGFALLVVGGLLASWWFNRIP